MRRVSVAGFAAAVSENFNVLEGAAKAYPHELAREAPAKTKVFVWRPEGLADVQVMRIEQNSTMASSYTDRYSIGVMYAGAFDWWYRGETLTHRTGHLKLKEPGEVHRDQRIHAPFTLQQATFSPEAIGEAAAALGHSGSVSFCRGNHDRYPCATRLAFVMHEALLHPVSPFETEVRIAEALAEILTSCTHRGAARRNTSRVYRARAFLHDALAEKVTLDELSAHVGLDKYHLVRAFRAEVGFPPYEYLTRIRIERARGLLALGLSPARVAHTVGLYDESQLHRHFRRIVGVSPGRYARAISSRPRFRQHRPSGAKREDIALGA